MSARLLPIWLARLTEADRGARKAPATEGEDRHLLELEESAAMRDLLGTVRSAITQLSHVERALALLLPPELVGSPLRLLPAPELSEPRR